jgi:hypothetical protein
VLVIPGFVESQSNTEIKLRKHDREHIEKVMPVSNPELPFMGERAVA